MTPFAPGYGQALKVTASNDVQMVRFLGTSSWVRIKAAGSVTVYFDAMSAKNKSDGYPISAEVFEGPLQARELWFTGSGDINILAMVPG